MRIKTLVAHLLACAPLAFCQSTSVPGYNPAFSTVPLNSTFSFGPNVAILNLDLINVIVEGPASTNAGKSWVNSTASWINFVHAQKVPPLQIFTRLYFSPGHPEVGPTSPIAAAVGPLAAVAIETSNLTQIYPAFNAQPNGYLNGTTRDVVLQKSRYDATYGTSLVEILIAQKIDTVVLSGVRTSGVILSTAYTLFDLDYKVYIISGNVIEPSNGPGINAAILKGVVPLLPANVITLAQAKAALARSHSNATMSMA